MQKSSMPSPNDILLVGGLIAGAYIVYKFSQGLSKASDLGAEITNDVVNVYNDIADTVKNAFTPNEGPEQWKPVDFSISDSIFMKGLSDLSSFSSLQQVDPYNPIDPVTLNSKTRAKGFTSVPMGQIIKGN